MVGAQQCGVCVPQPPSACEIPVTGRVSRAWDQDRPSPRGREWCHSRRAQPAFGVNSGPSHVSLKES